MLLDVCGAGWVSDIFTTIRFDFVTPSLGRRLSSQHIWTCFPPSPFLREGMGSNVYTLYQKLREQGQIGTLMQSVGDWELQSVSPSNKTCPPPSHQETSWAENVITLSSTPRQKEIGAAKQAGTLAPGAGTRFPSAGTLTPGAGRPALKAETSTPWAGTHSPEAGTHSFI